PSSITLLLSLFQNFFPIQPFSLKLHLLFKNLFMKKYFFLILIITYTLSMAQKKFDYESKWKEIEKAEKNGLQKSNLPAIQEIYAQAKKDKNTQQIVKSLMYQSKILLQTSDDEEETHLGIIQNFEKEI